MMEVFHSTMSKMLVYDRAGTGLLLPVVFNTLKDKAVDYQCFRLWASHFENNQIGGYLRFAANVKAGTVNFYCNWKVDMIAQIVYNQDGERVLSLPKIHSIGILA